MFSEQNFVGCVALNWIETYNGTLKGQASLQRRWKEKILEEKSIIGRRSDQKVQVCFGFLLSENWFSFEFSAQNTVFYWQADIFTEWNNFSLNFYCPAVARQSTLSFNRYSDNLQQLEP